MHNQPNGSPLSIPPPPKPTPRFKDADKGGYLELSYEELEERNLALREKVEKDEDPREQILSDLKSEKRVKALTVYFSDMEGVIHSLDYDKTHVLESGDNLTFDGSSISGFSSLDNSDLRFSIDWSSFRWAPADVFGAGKVIVFANISDQDGKPYEGDFRHRLKLQLNKLRDEENVRMNAAPEIEGLLLEGIDAEQNFDSREGMKVASQGGYCHALPQDRLKKFIDHLAESTRAMGFKNEKDHPEVAPGQFELTYRHRDALHAADQTLLYQLTARQIAANMGCTASFLPKPIAGINGNGMHMNISMDRDGENLFYDAEGTYKLSENARMFIAGILARGKAMCLVPNSSVNAYRRLDPNFEAPNEIKVHNSDRGSMIRIPLGNEKSARMELRSVAPDTNPYLLLYLLCLAGEEGRKTVGETRERLARLFDDRSQKVQTLPGNIQDAIEAFERSDFIEEAMGPDSKDKYLELKRAVADRSPKLLGTKVKKWEVRDHHSVRNQELSMDF
jgi:glutamine synthetase